MPLSLWTVYDHPNDYPEHFVARRFVLNQPTTDVLLSDTVDGLRELFVEKGLIRLERFEQDDPKIVEVWV